MLLGETPITKLLWLYLRPKGLVSYSTRKLAAALYLSQPVVSAGLFRLRDPELKLLEDVGEQRARVRSVYQAVEPENRKVTPALPSRSSSLETPRNPIPLPKVLADETPAVKLVYVYLEPHDEVEVSVRQLEVLLGVSHRPAAEALQRLVALGLLRVVIPPINRAGRYKLRI